MTDDRPTLTDTALALAFGLAIAGALTVVGGVKMLRNMVRPTHNDGCRTCPRHRKRDPNVVATGRKRRIA